MNGKMITEEAGVIGRTWVKTMFYDMTYLKRTVKIIFFVLTIAAFFIVYILF